MTIGSTYNYPSERAEEIARKKMGPPPRSAWSASFPNPPDLCFNYRKLVTNGIANAEGKNDKILIIGAGITGLTAARELYRAGFDNVVIYESNNRISGRLFTINNNESNIPQNFKYTPFEMGAMRMPFFNTSEQEPKKGMSLLAHYAKIFNLDIQGFPNPGTKFTKLTGIYLKDGLFDNSSPNMILWENTDGMTKPSNKKLQDVQTKWQNFEKLMVDKVSLHFGGDTWEDLWESIVKYYSDISFRQFVRLANLDVLDPNDKGNFGGLGLSEDESDLFYSIGFGDGSWGAFYDVCCLYPIRTAIFGFGGNLQLVSYPIDVDGKFSPGPYEDQAYISDTLNNLFIAPKYIGIQSLSDCMLFELVEKRSKSFYKHSMDRSTGFMTSMRVKKLKKLSDGKIEVTSRLPTGPDIIVLYDHVVITIPSWILEVDIELEGFDIESHLPNNVTRAYKTAHWETSCKVYAPISPEFFTNPENKIPHNIVTDSFIHDVYIYQYGPIGTPLFEKPCILLSYTWEDDASKLASFNDKELINKCIDELDRILMRSENIIQKISPYIEKDRGFVQRWISDSHAFGCARLYRAGTYKDSMSLLAYNRNYSNQSRIYLAGEAYSVDAGWVEPSLRGAIDCVINLCNNVQAPFSEGFSMDDYPKFRM
ncbi:Monoamine oxidase [Yersinia pseudotuberculosis]|uniref:Tryptophan 2-monooxygenase n=1 Tax=Yersinia wautersii TaxID=1341643 RepID=A0ABM9TF32_9GAMM|nr:MULTISPECIES: FAD-dependent oxidoreductase [Yersinia pseudotuberculosis complex]CFV22260.1 Monoamine oxidase [Yersinia pseudotuberculosis]CNL25227.1 Monoamine oxidase [Yersinia pseudotuberculosis]CRG50562.1 Monoamine oxidase [Yersinia wautersii]